MTEQVNILIVDDIDANIYAMRKLLRGIADDVNFVEATGGEEALEKMLDHEFALVLLDVQMPDMNGYEVAENMRLTEETKQIPIIFVTANSTEESNIQRGYASGAVDYITKPIDRTILRSKVSIFINLYKMNRQLKTALKEADAANYEKSRFLATMSHEIRTPLNGVIGLLELIAEEKDPELFDKYVQTASNSADMLLTIMNDILDFSKLEAGRFDITKKPVCLYQMVKEVTDILLHKAEESDIEFIVNYELDETEHYLLDPVRIKQVILNLMGNAIKFSEGGYVKLTVSRQNICSDGGEGTTSTLRFEVEDNGIGIAQDKQKYIFEYFTQADISTTRKFGGTGLGLAICSKLVTLMDGTIGVQSALGEGANFWFTVNSDNVAVEKAREEEERDLEVLANQRVLVVDDFQANLDVVSAYLKSWSVPCTALNRSTDALTELQKAAKEGNPYTIALLDYMMPEMDGIELASEIKKSEYGSTISLIMLTAAHKIEDLQHVKEVGYNDCLMKPIFGPDLLEVLCSAAESQSDADPVMAEKGDCSEVPSEARIDEVSSQNEKEMIDSGEVTSTEKMNDNEAKQILLVEDNMVNQMIAEQLLVSLGCDVAVAENGKIATEMVKEKSYQAVFMDCMMPVMDGYQATQHIRELEQQLANDKTLPIIALTANAMPEDRGKCLDAGMDDYITKPVKKEDLESMLSLHAL